MQRLCSRLTRALGGATAALLLVVPSVAAQTGSVAGRVIDAQSGQNIPAAQVFIANLDIGVLSQQNGTFILLNVPAGQHAVTVQRIGYGTTSQNVTVTAGQTAVLDFRLAEEALQLDEVIVTGTPGGTRRRALGNSVALVSAAEVTAQASINDMQELLAARTPGLRFGRNDGQVGGGSGITIRGVSSVLLGSQPLIYVDGVRIDNDATAGPNTGSGVNASTLNDLNPEEIESIEVIKGPAAATLYGTEASAGVIQIITKRGSVGAPEFTFETSQGTNFMVDPAGTLGTQYACGVLASVCPADQIVPVNMYEEASDYVRRQGRFADPSLGLDLNGPARSQDLFDYGYSQRYNLSVRGGTDQVRYYLSGAWQDETGVLSYNTDTGTNIRANITVLLSEDVNVDVSTAYAQGKSRFATVDEEGGVWHQLVWSRPSNLPGIRSASGSGFLGFQERFPESYEQTDIYRKYSRFTASVTTTHNYADWLTQRLIFGIDRGADTNNELIPGNADFPNAPAGALNYSRPINENLTFDYSISGRYELTEGFGTTTSFGAQYYSEYSETLSNSGLGFPVDRPVIDQGERTNLQNNFTSIETKSLGFYAQEELSWQDRIFLTAAIRADDNSAFGSEFDLEYYPKLSASWVISEESFFNVGVVDNFRLRGAWGQSGRQPGTFASQTLFSPFTGPNGTGLVPGNVGNPDIGPEVSTELELGFDVSLFAQRLSAEFSWYNTKTEDLLVNQALAPSSGLTGSRQANLGEMKNWGWEASLNARLVDMENVAFDLTLSGDHTMNEIVSLGEDALPNDNFQIGWPFPNIASPYLIREAELALDGSGNPRPGVVNTASLMCDQGQPAVAGGPNIMPGGPVGPCSSYTDAGLLLGPSFPTYTWSVAPTLTLFQDLQIFALAEGQYGRWVASVDANYACRYYRNCLKALERTDPFFLAGTSNFIDDRYNGRIPADFWKLRQVGVRYQLPQSIVGRAGADRASLSVSAGNFWTIWQKVDTDFAGNPIYDPEYAINGSQPSNTALWEMPGIANFNATLRVTF